MLIELREKNSSKIRGPFQSEREKVKEKKVGLLRGKCGIEWMIKGDINC